MDLRREAVDLFKKLNIRTASVLWDLEDQDLADFDRDLRLEMRKGFPKKLSKRLEEQIAKCTSYHAPALCYRVGHEPEIDTAVQRLEEACKIADTPQIRALANSMLVSYLAHRYRQMRAAGNLNDSIRDKEQCQQIANRALEEFAGEPWHGAIGFVLHAALGSLGRWSEELPTARTHFQKAIENYEQLGGRLQKNDRATLGIVHLEHGDVLRMLKESLSAETEYQIAISMLDGVSRVTAQSRLVSLILDGGTDLRRARRIAKDAIVRARKAGIRNQIVDELESNLAWVTWELGDHEGAKRLYQDLDREGVHPDIRNGVRKFLDTQLPEP